MWESVKQFYRKTVIRLGKGSKSRVEDLMKDILESVQLLSVWVGMEPQVLSALDQVQNISPPSLSDEECEGEPDRQGAVIVGRDASGNIAGVHLGDAYSGNASHIHHLTNSGTGHQFRDFANVGMFRTPGKEHQSQK